MLLDTVHKILDIANPPVGEPLTRVMPTEYNVEVV